MASAAAIAASRVPLDAAAFADMVGQGRVLSRLDLVKTSPSTNTALLEAVAAEPEEWPHLSALVADHQSAGRGRAGRSWATPPRAALTGSYVVRPGAQGGAVPREAYGWAPLVVGLATVRALRRAGIGAFLKWPNDVVVEAGARDIPEWGRWRKCVGILCETVPGQDAIVAGIGINVSQEPSELPVAHAASLATLGAASLDRTVLLRSLAGELRDAVDGWAADAAAGESERVAAAVAAACATLGWEVAVDVPGGNPVSGKAVRLSPEGGLVIATASGEQTVLAGDVRVRRAE